MRRSSSSLYKVPKNTSVAPRFDVWNEKYEPWAHMKRMGRIVGTGFYIPPEWYNHFRMFPPINHNFQQEKTLNPQNRSEPTQRDETSMSAERLALRDELARKSRSLASEGMRYFNIFWVQKPLDKMEREYFQLKRNGASHQVAIKKVLQSFYETLSVKKRVAQIQSEEARLSGGFISMREATTVLQVLSHLQAAQLTPQQVAELASRKGETARTGDAMIGRVERRAPAASPSATGDAAATASSAPSAATTTTAPSSAADISADALAAALEGDSQALGAAAAAYTVVVDASPNDTLQQLQSVTATEGTGQLDWFDGPSPSYPLPSSK